MCFTGGLCPREFFSHSPARRGLVSLLSRSVLHQLRSRVSWSTSSSNAALSRPFRSAAPYGATHWVPCNRTSWVRTPEAKPQTPSCPLRSCTNPPGDSSASPADMGRGRGVRVPLELTKLALVFSAGRYASTSSVPAHLRLKVLAAHVPLSHRHLPHGLTSNLSSLERQYTLQKGSIAPLWPVERSL